MSQLKAFPKILALGNRAVSTILDEPVEITEKIDGSQFVFGKIDGQLYIRSKGAEIHLDAPQKMFEAGVDYVVSIMDRLQDDVVYYCEYLQKPKHNCLTYNRIPKNHLMLFGVYDVQLDEFGSADVRNVDSAYLDIEPIPVIHSGPATPEQILEMINAESILGGPHMEGVVVKNYKDCWIGGQLKPIMSAKYVSEKFKETHRTSWKKEHTSRGKWDLFKEQFRCEARWQKAIQHLRDAGQLECDPRDIGKLIKEIHTDVQEEEKDRIVDFLWNEFKGELVRGSTKGFPEWYKEQLAKGEIE